MKFRELYLDTTYVMPFFYLDIDVKGFSRTVYKDVINSLERIHLSEISIIEAKANSLRICEKRSDANKKFNEGLSVLSADKNKKDRGPLRIRGSKQTHDAASTFSRSSRISNLPSPSLPTPFT